MVALKQVAKAKDGEFVRETLSAVILSLARQAALEKVV